ncbi:MAG: S-layer homology domain-containing protein [Clostridia bacterium]|nr:S-layer homology domain-containing protein [Clostridia bacterium]
MKEYNESVKLARGVSVALGAMLILGTALPTRAEAKLSPALDIIAAEYTVATNGLVGTDIYFSAEELSEALGVESVGKITIASLPDPTTGRLQLGAKYVEVGQTVSERNLDALKFVPFGNDAISADFSFCRGSDLSGTVYTCTVYTTKTVNAAPVITVSDSISASSGEIGVYSGITHLGTIPATDPEGDVMTFEILSAPSHGTVKLTDRVRGYYEYTANADFDGKDSFIVCATDKYGNRSAPAKLTLRVDIPSADEVYADMDGHWANSAVISCVRAGVIETAEENELFYPDEYISRAEFLTLAMNAAGYRGFSIDRTGFADDASIPEKYKGSIAAAEALGIIDGAGGSFYPNNQITRSEAAVIISRLTGITGGDSVAVFADSDAVPTWAVNAMHGLYSAGILRGTGSGSIDAYASVTRGAAMQMLSMIISK